MPHIPLLSATLVLYMEVLPQGPTFPHLYAFFYLKGIPFMYLPLKSGASFTYL